MNISRTDTLHAVLTSLLVAALVAYRPVRVGALLSAAGVLAAALVHTPVGLNATRLVVMFALPVLAAARPTAPAGRDRAAARPGRPAAPAGVVGAVALAVLLAAVCWWQPPVVAADLRSAGDPTSERAYFDPLRAELARRGLTGRVEVPPTRNYWEAAHLGETPLARGWLRQADIARNPLFFTTVPGATGTGVPLTAESYRAWLTDNAVQFVAVPDTELSWVGRAEAELVTAGLPYLTEVWSDRRWRLYAVADPTPLVGAPGELVRQDGASVTFRTPGARPCRSGCGTTAGWPSPAARRPPPTASGRRSPCRTQARTPWAAEPPPRPRLGTPTPHPGPTHPARAAQRQPRLALAAQPRGPTPHPALAAQPRGRSCAGAEPARARDGYPVTPLELMS